MRVKYVSWILGFSLILSCNLPDLDFSNGLKLDKASLYTFPLPSFETDLKDFIILSDYSIPLTSVQVSNTDLVNVPKVLGEATSDYTLKIDKLVTSLDPLKTSPSFSSLLASIKQLVFSTGKMELNFMYSSDSEIEIILSSPNLIDSDGEEFSKTLILSKGDFTSNPFSFEYDLLGFSMKPSNNGTIDFEVTPTIFIKKEERIVTFQILTEMILKDMNLSLFEGSLSNTQEKLKEETVNLENLFEGVDRDLFGEEGYELVLRLENPYGISMGIHLNAIKFISKDGKELVLQNQEQNPAIGGDEIPFFIAPASLSQDNSTIPVATEIIYNTTNSNIKDVFRGNELKSFVVNPTIEFSSPFYDTSEGFIIDPSPSLKISMRMQIPIVLKIK